MEIALAVAAIVFVQYYFEFGFAAVPVVLVAMNSGSACRGVISVGDLDLFRFVQLDLSLRVSPFLSPPNLS